MKDPRIFHDESRVVKISGFNKKYFPKDYAEQTKNDSYQEAKNSPSGNRDIHIVRRHKKIG